MKIYIAEDDALLRTTLTEQLSEFCPGAEVVGANGNGQVAMSECTELKPDLIILDIRLPELSGLHTLQLFKEKFPQIKIQIYSGLADQESTDIVMRDKADGHIMKCCGLEEIAEAIKVIEAGGTYFRSELFN